MHCPDEQIGRTSSPSQSHLSPDLFSGTAPFSSNQVLLEFRRFLADLSQPSSFMMEMSHANGAEHIAGSCAVIVYGIASPSIEEAVLPIAETPSKLLDDIMLKSLRNPLENESYGVGILTAFCAVKSDRLCICRLRQGSVRILQAHR